MKLGMTGSREGITNKGFVAFYKYLKNNIRNIEEVHHGDCEGADEEFHDIISAIKKKNKIKRVIHPPSYDTLRAYCEGDELRPKKPYIERNHNIVDETDALIAFPPTQKEIMKSGSWTTIRYARKQKKSIYIIFPDGEVKIEN